MKQNLLWLAMAVATLLPHDASAFKPETDSESLGHSVDAKARNPMSSLRHLRGLRMDDLAEGAKGKAPKDGIRLQGKPSQAVLGRLNARLSGKGSKMEILRVQEDGLGNSHIRLRQIHHGIPVIGTDVVVHVDSKGRVYGVGGKIGEGLQTGSQPGITSKQALRNALEQLGLPPGQARKDSGLVIFDGRLAYEQYIEGENPHQALWRCFIDAETGELLFRENRIIHAGPGPDGAHEPLTGSVLPGEGGSQAHFEGWHDTGGNHFLYHQDSLWRVFNEDFGDWEQRPTSDWGGSDPAALSLGYNLHLTQRYVREVLGMNSFNDGGIFATGNVHVGTNYVNAYWNGSQFYFGDGDGITADPLTVLDIVAHEYGHAVTQYSSDLVYSYESGALNESFSDILGALVEFHAQSDGRGSYPEALDGQADWLMGEDSWLDQTALRDLRNPNRYGAPSYYKGRFWYYGSGDNGGVHTNSGVQNFAFYLLAEGGSGTNDGHPYNITGLGIEAAGAIAMYANRFLLTSNSQYQDSRAAWELAAQTLGFNVQTVRDVWSACGVMPMVNHLAAAPMSLDFGNVGTGSSAVRIVALTNSGANATTVYSLAFSNSAFGSSQAVPFSIPGGGRVDLRVTFSPVALGSRSGTLDIASNAMDNPSLMLSLSGAGTAPAAMVLTPGAFSIALNSGDQAQRVLDIANSGVADLDFKLSAASGSILINEVCSDPDFIEIWNQGPDQDMTGWSLQWVDNTYSSGSLVFPTGFILRSGQTVVIRENAGQNDSATLYTGFNLGWITHTIVSVSLLDNGAGVDFMRTSGSTTAPPSGTAWNGEGVSFANESAWRNTNADTDDATGWSNTFEHSEYIVNPGQENSTLPTWLSLSPSQGQVPGGQSQQVTLTFDATGLIAGTYSNELSIQHNDPSQTNPAIVPLQLGVSGVKRLSASPSALSFPNTWVNGSDTLSLTLFNNGSDVTTVDSISNGNGLFSIAVPELPFNIAAFGSVPLKVVFEPTDLGAKNATLTIQSDAADNPVVTVSLSGTAVPEPQIGITPASVAVSLNAGGTAQRDLVLTNPGGDTLLWSVEQGNPLAPAHISLSSEVLAQHESRTSLLSGLSSHDGRHPSPKGNAGIPFDAAASSHVLIFRDYLPWGYDVNAPILTALGASVSIAGSWQMASIDLTPYDVIVFASQQPLAFYNAYVSSLPRFESFLHSGGKISFHAACYEEDRIPNLPLPGGMTTLAAFDGDYENTIADPTHPIVAGLTDPLWGNLASHEAFIDIPATATVVTVNESGIATTVQYSLGAGILVATGMPWEFGRGYGWSTAGLLDNALAHILQASHGAAWLDLSQTSGSVPPGGTQTVTLGFDAAGITAGLHQQVLGFVNNAPAGPSPFEIPVELTVNSLRSLSASPNSLAFGSNWIGTSSILQLTLENVGNDTTAILSMISNHPDFSVVPGGPQTVAPWSSATVSIEFAASTLGPVSGTLTIQSAAQDNPSIGIALSGEGTTPPVAQLSPPTLEFILAPNDAPADQTAVLSNSGGDVLRWSLSGVQQTGEPGFRAFPAAPAKLPAIRESLMYSASNLAQPFHEGRVILALKPGVEQWSPQGIAQSLGIQSIRPLAIAKKPGTGLLAAPQRRLFLLRLERQDAQSVLDALDILRQDDRVAYVEPDYKVQAIATPDDPDYSLLWGMHNTGQGGGTPDADIDAPEAWDRHKGNKSILIGVIDTGIDYLHPDLIDNMWTNPGEIPGDGIDNDGNGFVDDIHGWDFAYDDNDPMDGHFHGTHCAGTIAGRGDNGIGVAGVMWDASLVALKFLDDGGYGSTSDAVDAMNYANAMGIQITSNSWGGGGYSQALADVIAAGGLFIAAAGNYSIDIDANPEFPASYDLPNVLSVAATDRYDNLSDFSNWGLNSVDLGAPGTDIWSTFPGGSYEYLSGTSMATPHVSGAAGLVWSLNNGLGALEVKDILMQSVDPTAAMAGRVVTGGRLNVEQAILVVGPSWLSIAPSGPGTVNPGQSQNLVVTADPAGLRAGEWQGQVTIATDDPANPELLLTVTARISGCRSVSVTPASLDFGTVWVDHISSSNLTLTNSCNDTTLITSLDMSGQNFELEGLEPTAIPPFGNVSLPVRFVPRSEGTHTGQLTVTTNADADPIQRIALAGKAVQAPKMVLLPQLVAKRLRPESTLVQEVLVHNSGGDALQWQVSNVYQGIAPAMEYDKSHFIQLPKGGADPRVGRPVIHGAGGPDAFGYRWSDSDEPGGPEFAWIDISATGSRLASISTCDDCFESMPLGFTFDFYGNSYSSVFISSNGYLTFGVGSTEYSNFPLPSSFAPANIVAAFYDDLLPASGGDVYFQSFGSRAVVQYQDVMHIDGNGAYTFQVELLESGEILFRYLRVSGDLLSSTVGIQNLTQDVGLLVAYNTPYVRDSLAVRIATSPAWLHLSQLQGTLYPGDTQSLTMRLDAAGLGEGSYTHSIDWISNDPNPAATEIQVFLEVSSGATSLSRVLGVGAGAQPAASGLEHHIFDLRIGSPATGAMSGSQYRLRLR